MKNYKSAILICLGASLAGYFIGYSIYGHWKQWRKDTKTIKKCYSPTCNTSSQNYLCYSSTCPKKEIDKQL